MIKCTTNDFREKPSHSLVLIGNKVQDVSAPGGEVKSQKSKVLNPLATNESSTFFVFG